MTPDFHSHAKQRLISNAYPGWWVRVYDEGTDEQWMRVKSVQNFTSKEPAAKPVTQLVVVDDAKQETAEVVQYSNEYVLCCTKAEAKKAGAV